MLKQESITARVYRNSQVGDFLKELHLTEGRATGFTRIHSSMHNNESPKPIFTTDPDRTFFLTTLKAHPSVQIKSQLTITKYEEFSDREKAILQFCTTPQKRADILEHINLKNERKSYIRHILPLIDNGWITMTIPDKPRSTKQRYVLTEMASMFINVFLKEHEDKHGD